MNYRLFNAILSMDSYNRGYDAGIKFGNGQGNYSNDAADTKIGSASIITNSTAEFGNGVDSGKSFYALAYDYNGETIISYRGTDNNDFPFFDNFRYGWGLGDGQSN